MITTEEFLTNSESIHFIFLIVQSKKECKICIINIKIELFHFLELFLSVLANAMGPLSSLMLFSLNWAWPTEFPNMSIASCDSVNENDKNVLQPV